MVDQIYVLTSFFVTGICIGIIFDLFRLTRKVFKLPDIIIYIEDILFWCLAGILILYTIFTFTTGEIRLYMIIIMLFACFLYFISISKFLLHISTKILISIKNITKFLLLPLKKLINFRKNSVK